MSKVIPGFVPSIFDTAAQRRFAFPRPNRDIENEIKTLKAQIESTRKRLAWKKERLYELENELSSSTNSPTVDNILPPASISRYSRQIILPCIGKEGQLLLQNSKVLVVGAGGLGCPAALYLVTSGVGRIGLVDYDEVDITNLNRQILHTEMNVATPKVISAYDSLRRLSTLNQIIAIKEQLNQDNAFRIIKEYDVVIDATDNVVTRYLLNDACVMLKKPFVSGSALRMEGQLVVHNYKGSPCYRCLYPDPPPADTVRNCSEAGILGPVCGTIGVLQALEAIKIILNWETKGPKMLLFDGMDLTFKSIKIRERRKDCSVCGENPTIKKLVDYEVQCGAVANDRDSEVNLLPMEHRISPKDLQSLMDPPGDFVLIDTRTQAEYEMCHLPFSINIPLDEVCENTLEKIKEYEESKNIRSKKVVFICRRGNDSQRAVLKFKNWSHSPVVDVCGGLRAWTKEIDPSFPFY